MHTEDSVSFFCHINVSSGWEYLWYKDDVPITVSGDNYNISSVVTKHSGSYKCRVEREGKFESDKSLALSLQVEGWFLFTSSLHFSICGHDLIAVLVVFTAERPQAEITLLTGWSEVFSTDTLVLQCQVEDSQQMWNYTW